VADKSSIEWTDATWNPVTGCTKVSLGCDHCYAERIVERFKGKGAFENVTLNEERLEAPLRWRKPRRVFVNSMSDLFHESVPDRYIADVFAVMALAKQHTFQVLTKRHGRMRSLLRRKAFRTGVQRAALKRAGGEAPWLVEPWWPLRNVWLGVSVEDQKWADIRVPALLDTPAAVRFLSCEPLLGPVDLAQSLALWQPGDDQPWKGNRLPARDILHWVIVGGESGPGARPMHPDWARSLRDQCAAAGVPFFHKQNGAWIEAERDTATHLLQVDGYLVDRKNATVDNPYGEGSGLAQDLVDRGHPGWVRVRRVSKHDAGRELDGSTHDGYPEVDRG
jgi:protein gp37